MIAISSGQGGVPAGMGTATLASVGVAASGGAVGESVMLLGSDAPVLHPTIKTVRPAQASVVLALVINANSQEVNEFVLRRLCLTAERRIPLQ
jgi:hypothetical protein